MGLFKKKQDKVFKQDLSQKEGESHLFFMWLLFDQEPQRPDADTVHKKLEQKFGAIHTIMEDEKMSSYALPKYMSEFADNAKLPTQVVMGDIHSFDQDKISEFERGQIWDCPDGKELLDHITHRVMLWDMMDTLDFMQKSEMLMDWLETALDLYKECVAVWIPSAGKLIMADEIRRQSYRREDRFLHYCVNARFFTVNGSDDMIVDTRGMYAMGLPDVQCHFHGIDPNDVVYYVYNIAMYIFKNRMPIEDGDTIDGLRDGELVPEIQWKCQYEDSLVQPLRPVIDICPGEFAAGTRE